MAQISKSKKQKPSQLIQFTIFHAKIKNKETNKEYDTPVLEIAGRMYIHIGEDLTEIIGYHGKAVVLGRTDFEVLSIGEQETLTIDEKGNSI